MVLDVAANGGSGVKMVVSYGGEIMTCSDTGKARYAGGENRIVRVGMSERLSELRARLAALAGYPDVRIQYAVAAGPGGDGLDTLHDVADDHDLWVLVTRLCCCNGLASRDGRVRAFLFPINAPPRATQPDGIPRPSSSPSLLESSKQQGRGVAAASSTFTLPRAQSAMALSTCTSASSKALSAAQVDSGFEALAEIAAAQRSATGKEASSSSSCAAASTGQVHSGFDALAGIAAAQRSATGYTARGAGATCAAKADSGFEALATVAVAAGQQRVQVFPPPASAVFLYLVLPVAPVAVFFHAIPVYGCLIPAVL